MRIHKITRISFATMLIISMLCTSPVFADTDATLSEITDEVTDPADVSDLEDLVLADPEEPDIIQEEDGDVLEEEIAEPDKTDEIDQTDFEDDLELLEEGTYEDDPDLTGEELIYEMNGYTYDLKYTVLSSGNVCICGYTGRASGNLVIPKKIEGKNVTEIGNFAFNEAGGFTGTLDIPVGVTSIGSHAFAGCDGLIGDLVIPNGVKTLGQGAFRNCTGFNGQLSIPGSLTSIADWTFYDCPGLCGDLIIPKGVTSIGKDAFRACTGFKGSLTMADSVTSIGEYAFYECTGFTGNLVLPDSLTDMEGGVFYNCKGFTGLTISKGLSEIPGGLVSGCSGLKGTLTIPENITTIGDSAFSGCKNFTGELVIPDSVTTMGADVFYGCKGFTGLTISKGLSEIPGGLVSGCSGLTGVLIIPENITAIGDSAFRGCEKFTGELVIPDSVTSIGASAFYGCTRFTGDLMIPDNVISIGTNAFNGCTGFTGNLIISEGIVSIGDSAFEYCKKLTGDILIPATVKTIGASAFYRCEGFDGELTIPDGVTSIGRMAFDGCKNLTGDLTVPGSVVTIKDRTFHNCRGLNGNIVIGSGITTIEEDAFYIDFESSHNSSVTSYTPGFKNIYLPGSLTEISDNAFDYAWKELEGLEYEDGNNGEKYNCVPESEAYKWAHRKCPDKLVTWDGTQPAPDGFYTITYDANGAPDFALGGIPEDKSQYASGKTAIVKKINKNSIAAINFLGWSLDKDSGTPDPDIKKNQRIKMDGNKTLYAIWERSWDSYGITELDPDVYHEEASGGNTVIYKLDLSSMTAETIINLSVELKGPLLDSYCKTVLYDESGIKQKESNMRFEYDAKNYFKNYKMMIRRKSLLPGVYYISVHEKNTGAFIQGLSASYGIYVTTYREEGFGIDLTKDTFPLLNFADAFNIECLKESDDSVKTFYMPTQYWKDVFDQFSIRLFELDRSLFQKHWRGYCFGLSAVPMMFGEGKITKPAAYLTDHDNQINPSKWPNKDTSANSDNSYKFNGLDFPKLNQGSKGDQQVHRLIADYQIWQYSSDFSKWREAYLQKYNDTSNTHLINWQVFDDAINKNKTLIITVQGKGEDLEGNEMDGICHSLLVDSCRTALEHPNANEDNDIKRYYLYDPNYPFSETLSSSGANYYKYSENRYMDVNTKTGEWTIYRVSENSENSFSPVNIDQSSEIFIEDTSAVINNVQYSIPVSFNGDLTYATRKDDFWSNFAVLSFTGLNSITSPGSMLMVRTADNIIKVYKEYGKPSVVSDDAKNMTPSVANDNSTFYKYLLPKDDYSIEFESGELEFIINDKFTRISSEDKVKLDIVSNSDISVRADSDSEIRLLVAEIDDKKQSYSKIRTSLDIGTEPTQIAIRDGEISIESPTEQSIDLETETESGEGLIEDISTDSIKNISIKDNVTVKHTLTFDAQGGTAVAAMDGIEEGTTVKLPTTTRDGYKFGGWFTGINGKGTKYTDQTLITKDVTLYAYWTKNKGLDNTLIDIGKVTVQNLTYNGKEQKPVIIYSGKTLAENVDYTWSKADKGRNYKDAGTYKVGLTGKGKYTGNATKQFTIKAKAVTPTVTLSAKEYTYNGKAMKPKVTVKDGSTELAASDYSVTYAKGRKNVGNYSVTVQLKGNYSGMNSASFRINPKGTSISGVKGGSKSIKVNWKKQKTKMSKSRITGYEIMVATNSKFTKNKKTVNVKGYSKTSNKVTKLKAGKKYYVRVRTYSSIKGKKYYSTWSKAKTVKTK